MSRVSQLFSVETSQNCCINNGFSSSSFEQSLSSSLNGEKTAFWPKLAAKCVERSTSSIPSPIFYGKNEGQVRNLKFCMFFGKRIPPISLVEYAIRLDFALSKQTEASIWVCTIIYLKRLIDAGLLMTPFSCHRAFLMAFTIAMKNYCDFCPCSSSFAKIGGITAAEHRRLEIVTLAALNFRLQITNEDFVGELFEISLKFWCCGINFRRPSCERILGAPVLLSKVYDIPIPIAELVAERYMAKTIRNGTDITSEFLFSCFPRIAVFYECQKVILSNEWIPISQIDKLVHLYQI
jgi:hypothetical protein